MVKMPCLFFSDTELDMSGLAEGGVCRAVNVADPLDSHALLTVDRTVGRHTLSQDGVITCAP